MKRRCVSNEVCVLGLTVSQDGYFSYSYRLRPGVNWDSHGLKVAQLAGLPSIAIETATSTLKSLQ